MTWTIYAFQRENWQSDLVILDYDSCLKVVGSSLTPDEIKKRLDDLANYSSKIDFARQPNT